MEFKHGLTDESVPEHRDASSSSHELPFAAASKVVPSKHNIFTHFPKDRNCDICLKTKITRASCRRRTGTVVPRAENVGDLTTADHEILSEGMNRATIIDTPLLDKIWQRSGHNPTHAKTKTSQETQKN